MSGKPKKSTIDQHDRMVKLADRIERFIDKYAAVSPNYVEGEDSEDEKYTGPDPYQLKMVAHYFSIGQDAPRYPWSEWGSGCYRPYTSSEGRTEHESIMQEIKNIRRELS